MADTSPYSDDLDESGKQQPQGDEPGSTYGGGLPLEEPAEEMDSPATEEPGIEYSDADLDAEPNDTDSQLFPPDDVDDVQDEDEGEDEDEDEGDDGDEDEGDDEDEDEDEGDDEDEDESDDEDEDEGEGDDNFMIDEDLTAGDAFSEFDDPNDTDSLATAEQLAGTVSFVGVPIGNYGDITQRAVRTLQMTDIVVCEDVKTAARLLQSFNITKKLQEMNERNEEKVSDDVIGMLRAGKRVAVIAGAGLPILAAPGGILAVKLRRMGIEPRIIPGVNSVMVGLIASGFSMDNFDFVGVLPRRPEERSSALQDIAGRDRTIVMLETAFRLRSLLGALAEVMPERQAALTINLTGPSESVVRGTVGSLNERFSRKRFKGEMVLVLDRLEPTKLGLGMSTTTVTMDDYDDIEEADGQHESSSDDAGSRPFRRTARTATPFAGRAEGQEERRERPGFGDRPERDAGRGERPAWGERRNDRRGGEDGGRERRPGGWNREGGGERRPGGGERKPGGWGGGERKSSGGGWNRDAAGGGGERKPGGWNRDGGGGERKSGGWGGGERKSSGGGWNRDAGGGGERKPGGWNRDGGGGGERKSGGWGGGERKSSGGGWNRDAGGGGERKPGGWNRDGGGGERKSGGWGGGERKSSGGGWNRDAGGGGERKPGGWNRDAAGGGGGERRSGGGGSRPGSGGPRRPGPGGPSRGPGRGGPRGGGGSRGGWSR